METKQNTGAHRAASASQNGHSDEKRRLLPGTVAPQNPALSFICPDPHNPLARLRPKGRPDLLNHSSEYSTVCVR